MVSANADLIERVRAYLRTQLVVPDPEGTLREADKLLRLHVKGDRVAAERQFARCKQHLVPTGIEELAELGDGLIAVYDTQKECSAYFDVKRWGAQKPYTPESLEFFPSDLYKRGIGVLWVTHVPQDIPTTLVLAKIFLEPKDGSSGFYQETRMVRLE